MKIRNSIPNILTTFSFTLGLSALMLIFSGQLSLAAYLIIIAAIFDSLDGYAARKLKATSKFGEEFDSLNDIVTFVIVPSLLIFNWTGMSFSILNYFSIIIFCLAGAYRLARFNCHKTNGYFEGLPTTYSGFIIAQIYLLNSNNSDLIRISLLLILSYFMVSKLPYIKLGYVLNKIPFGVFVLTFIIAIVAPKLFLITLTILYFVSPLIIIHIRQRRFWHQLLYHLTLLSKKPWMKAILVRRESQNE